MIINGEPLSSMGFNRKPDSFVGQVTLYQANPTCASEPPQTSIPTILVNLLNIGQLLTEIGRRNKNEQISVLTFAENFDLIG